MQRVVYYALVSNHMLLEPERKGQKVFYKKVDKISNKCLIANYSEAIRIKKDLDDHGAFKGDVKIIEIIFRG